MFAFAKFARYASDCLVQGTLLPKRRSSEWPKTRKTWLEQHPTCSACGGSTKPEVHHMTPFHLDPSKELDPTNFITLCESTPECHLRTGHLGNWKKFNANVVADAAKELAQAKL